VAFNGTVYLVVWSDERNAQTAGLDIYGSRVSTDGTVLDPGGLHIASGALHEDSAQVASNGSDFLVTWDEFRPTPTGQGSDIVAARVSGAGAVLDRPGIRVATGPKIQGLPDVGASSSGYLVAWLSAETNGGDTDVHAALVGFDGRIARSDFVVASSPNAQWEARVGGRPGGFLVTWNEVLGDYWFSGRALDADGTPLGPATVLGDGRHNDLHSSLDWNGEQFLIGWHQAIGDGGVRAMVTRVSGTGEPLDTDGLVVRDSRDACDTVSTTSVLAQGAAFRLFVDDGTTGCPSLGQEDGLYFGSLTGSNVSGLKRFELPNRTRWFDDFETDGSRFLRVWEQDDPTGSRESDVYGSILTGAGDMVSPAGFPISIEAQRRDTTPPSTSAPKVTVPVGRRVTGVSVPVQIAWTASDKGGVVRTALQVSVDGSTFTDVRLGGPSEVSARYMAALRSVHRFRIRATDQAGNRSAWRYSQPLRLRDFAEDASPVTYKGAWLDVNRAGAIGGGIRTSQQPSSSATFTFTGRGVAWLGSRGPSYGVARIWVDGRHVANVDLGATALRSGRVLFTRTWQRAGQHRLKVVVSGAAPAASRWVDVDGFLKW
jgi:hypothetical protein